MRRLRRRALRRVPRSPTAMLSNVRRRAASLRASGSGRCASRLSVSGWSKREVAGGEVLLKRAVGEPVKPFAVRGEQPGAVAQVLLEPLEPHVGVRRGGVDRVDQRALADVGSADELRLRQVGFVGEPVEPCSRRPSRKCRAHGLRGCSRPAAACATSRRGSLPKAPVRGTHPATPIACSRVRRRFRRRDGLLQRAIVMTPLRGGTKLTGPRLQGRR